METCLLSCRFIYNPLPDWFDSEAELIGIMKDILNGLSDMFYAGYFHLDVKSSNILLKPSGEAILCDFGLAQKYHSQGIISGCYGTEGYRAPEVEESCGPYDGSKADVYSLAKTMRFLAQFCLRPLSTELNYLLSKMEADNMEDRMSIDDALEFLHSTF
jgi:serine/threonine protein kinase